MTEYIILHLIPIWRVGSFGADAFDWSDCGVTSSSGVLINYFKFVIKDRHFTVSKFKFIILATVKSAVIYFYRSIEKKTRRIQNTIIVLFAVQ